MPLALIYLFHPDRVRRLSVDNCSLSPVLRSTRNFNSGGASHLKCTSEEPQENLEVTSANPAAAESSGAGDIFMVPRGASRSFMNNAANPCAMGSTATTCEFGQVIVGPEHHKRQREVRFVRGLAGIIVRSPSGDASGASKLACCKGMCKKNPASQGLRDTSEKVDQGRQLQLDLAPT